jgi:hypothetical protein
MPQRQALTAKQGFAANPQLRHLFATESIQRPGQRRLLGKLLATPRLRQGYIRTQPGVHLRDRSTSRQNADQYVEQLRIWTMRDALQRQL